MGNVQPLPCTCKEAMVVHATVAMKAKRKKPLVANNVGGGTADQDGGKGKEATLPECRVRVEELAAGEDGGVRLKVVATRKDAAEFVARLEKRAADRKARIEELVNGGMMSPCRDAWRPRLATIPEN
ncbi:hypothetical protein D1007_30378 [Hordeum vulgare]|nr:hypothetical protein D1007_30378 [Hordeum vulgare]